MIAGDRTLELRIPPLLLVALCAAAMFGCARLLPSLDFALPGRLAGAVVLAGAGIGIATAGVATFRRHGTTVNPLTPDATAMLVSGGIYRVSRNPMYLGMLVLLAGWALWLANAAAPLLLPLFVAYLNRVQIAPEERLLLARFGPQFAHYMATVRRWL